MTMIDPSKNDLNPFINTTVFYPYELFSKI